MPLAVVYEEFDENCRARRESERAVRIEGIDESKTIDFHKIIA